MKRQLLVSYLSITSLVILVLGLPLGVSYTKLVDDDARHLWLLLVVTAAVMLGIVILVSLLLARSLTKPLHDLHGAAVELGRGDLAVRAPVPDGPAEMTVLAESFNQTAARLEQLVGTQQAFVADASHQLRTPLAALRLRLENVEAEVDGSVAEDLEGALAEVRRLSRLVDGLLAMARAEQAVSTPVLTDVESVLQGRVEAWEAFAAERQVAIESTVGGRLLVRATPGRLEQVLDNLLNNALEVAPTGSAVRLGARVAGPAVELSVSDEGPGMTPEERGRAFDRFWQSAETRQHGRPEGHCGLGLAIVREHVVNDGGTVALRPSSSGGLTVTVRLPGGAVPEPVRSRQSSVVRASSG